MTIRLDAIILAAGTASRMGRTKQLLPLAGKLLLEHVISQVRRFPFSRIHTVIGHDAHLIQEQIYVDDRRFQWLLNPEFKEGLGTSLRKGLQEVIEGIEQREAQSSVQGAVEAQLQANRKPEWLGAAAMVFLADLPFIQENTISQIIARGLEQTQKDRRPFLIHPCYQDTSGHPVFWGNLQADVIKQIAGDRGGGGMRDVLRMSVTVQDPGICTDIDTPEAYERAIRLAESR
ncbi:NTP transferase domain-containing protein [Brevibacillus ruminantium]|uniref:NTP transferase domain-containing protein n=1 Tax=Brevibacillus ruminantium TaxID=2950604 RepID=A0ABY4W8H9_9BACL|nr:NTP transferase domain-containing protein [Brevibacillus ruminantium]USG63363.1 NTP transferase domain-containing protein [Brevibacillus ruminantium]